MAHESFEDEEVAKILNGNYVAIKVDKEERPDIDAVYMAVCLAFTGSGGWPMTIIMSPEQKPFFAGTYFPKTARYNVPGLMDILNSVRVMWQNEKEKLVQAGNNVAQILHETKHSKGEAKKELAEAAAGFYQKTFDDKYGGFGNAPKFPTPHNLMFLLRYYFFTDDKKALEMVETTLRQMYRGGIFDHIGFGFSRYSTDPKWLVPHFEKMLYDNALLTIVYLEAYQLTQKDFYKRVAEKTLAYVMLEMKNGQGGFYSAQDADSEGVEGKYYVFTPSEIIKLLGEKDGTYFNNHFGITENGNFEGANIPNLLLNTDYEEANSTIEVLNAKVYNYRKNRTVLHKDDKILTAWNALMIVALAKAYRILGKDEYLKEAKQTITFIEEKLRDENGELLVSYRNGKAANKGHLDDYAFMVWALWEMYEACFEEDYLIKALSLQKKLLANFYDHENGGFYLYAENAEQLILRPKETYDGAIPSGNSVCAYNLVVLSKLTGDVELGKIAHQQLQFMAGFMQNQPSAYAFGLLAVLATVYSGREVVACLSKTEDGNELEQLKKIISNEFLPNTVWLLKKDGELNSISPFAAAYKLKEDKTTFYVCENNTCSAPFNDVEELKQKLVSN